MRRRSTVVHSPKLVERRRMVRHERMRRRRRIALAAALIAAIGSGAWMMTGTAVFAVSAIEVEGATLVDEQRVIEASRLHVGGSALGTDLAEAAARVRALAGVRDARIVRSGLVLRIVVEEAKPAVEVHGAERVWVLDRDGQPLPIEGGLTDVPVVALTIDLDPEGASPLTAEVIDGVRRVWRELRDKERGRLRTLFLTPEGTASFHLGAVEVRFGTLSEVRRKLASMRAVRRTVAGGSGRLVSIDLRAPDRPAAVIA